MTETGTARVDISVGVQSKKMRTEERWTPTTVSNETLNYETILDDYLTKTSEVADEINSIVQARKENGWEVFVHFNVRLDNVTHVPVAKGVLPLAKGHRDAGMTHLELTSKSAIENFLNEIVADLKQKARY